MSRFKALVVDDSRTLRRVVVAALQRIPELSCIEAADGAEGLRCLSTEHVDLIITDLQMPVMNGFAFINYLRRRVETAGVPVVVVTAAGTDDDQRKLEAAGVRAFLRKPVPDEELRSWALALLPGATG